MRARLLAGEQLHHPFDRKACPQPAPFHLHHVWTNRDAVESTDCLPIATSLIETDPSREQTR
ncbi:hypothetical protein CKO51_30720 [Rhodopirellula sp. SM50]|nr:hypothetical protein CKO51_30720 [Rhodopirellula sp. SM50]